MRLVDEFSLERLIKVASDPKRAAGRIHRKWLPLGVMPKDRQAKRVASWNYGKLPRERLVEIFEGIEKVDIELHKVFERVEDLSLDLNELVVLCCVARFIKPNRLLEIGTYDGNTALNLAANTGARAKIVTVDLPSDWNSGFAVDVPRFFVDVTRGERVGEQFRGAKWEKKITQLRCDSAKIDWGQFFKPFDLVFIDGCHYYDYVKLDSKNCLRNMKKGGVIVWHDYGMLEDVSRVVDELAGEMKIRAVEGTRLAIGIKS